VRVLFSAETPLSLTSYQSVIQELGERGHEVIVAIHEEREIGWLDRLLAEIARPHVTVERAVSPGGDRWL
jgi:predicted glycosyltransferase